MHTYGLIFYKMFTVRWSQPDIFVIDDSNCIAVTALLPLVPQLLVISGKMLPVSKTTLVNLPQHQYSSCGTPFVANLRK